MNLALAAVLERPDIWRGDALAVLPAPTLPSGFAELDAELPGGGWPRGQLTELLYADEGIGELSLLMPAFSSLTASGKRVVLVLPPNGTSQPHAPGWAAAGVELSQLIVLRPANVRDALWATVESLRCAGVAATLAWPDAGATRHGRPADALSNSLRRLQTAAGEGGGCGFVLRPSACAVQTSPAPLRLLLKPEAQCLRVELIKRHGPPARRPLLLPVARPLVSTLHRHALARPYSVVHQSRLVAFA
jgi:cell division inhibitor SulA/protein ImuA